MNNIIYVSPMGGGSYDGSSPQNAVKGLFNAVDVARKTNEPRTVMLLPGEYVFSETLKLDERDSNTTFIGENSVISGGVKITDWIECGNGIVSADIPSDATLTRLYVNGTPRERTRYPQNGHLRSLRNSVNPNSWANKVENEDFEEIGKRLLHFDPQDIPFDIYRPEDVEFIVLQYWMEKRGYIEKFDRENGEALLTSGSWRSLSWSFGYYLENVREGLSVPGRWYRDFSENKLYYHLNEGETLDSVKIEYSKLQRLIEVIPTQGNTVENISFSGITFANTNAEDVRECKVVPQAELHAPVSLYFKNTVRCKFDHCTFKNLGGYALWVALGCKNWIIDRCTFTHCGAGAMRIGEAGRPSSKADECRNHRLTNNKISDCGEFYLGSAGIWIGQSGYNEVSHNDISGPLQWAICAGWNWSYFPLNKSVKNHICKNFIHELGTGPLGTHGAIYTLGSSPETVIEENYIRNIYSTPYWGGGNGVILDNGCTGITVQNNIITKTSSGGWNCNFNCFGNIIRNNIISFGSKYQLTRYGDPPDTEIPPPNGEVFTQNIILWEEGPLFPEKWVSFSTLWNYNLYWNTNDVVNFSGMTFEEWNALGLDRNSIIADPLFKDPKNEDFTLAEDSPAFKIGFEPFTLDDVGVLPETTK